MTDLCSSCGQPIPSGDAKPLSPAEREALSAWWHTGSVDKAAALLSRAPRTVVNQLYSARTRDGVHTTHDLMKLHYADLIPLGDLVTRHNNSGRKAA